MSDYLEKLIEHEEMMADMINVDRPDYEGSPDEDIFKEHQSNICSLLAIRNHIGNLESIVNGNAATIKALQDELKALKENSVAHEKIERLIDNDLNRYCEGSIQWNILNRIKGQFLQHKGESDE